MQGKSTVDAPLLGLGRCLGFWRPGLSLSPADGGRAGGRSFVPSKNSSAGQALGGRWADAGQTESGPHSGETSALPTRRLGWRPERAVYVAIPVCADVELLKRARTRSRLWAGWAGAPVRTSTKQPTC